MSAADRSVWFVGDLDDPWVASLAAALPAGARRIACAGDLPEGWPVDVAEAKAGVASAPRVVVLHRAWLSPFDAERLARLRGRVVPAPRVVLCIGSHVRHADLEHWSVRGLIDAIVPEATARDTIARHLVADRDAGDGGARRPTGPRTRVAVVSANAELRRTLADACAALGYSAKPACDWSEADPTRPAVWDVPVLEPDWTRVLARRARLGPVVVLLGFADRALVGQARRHGAAACLELPYDLLDLGHVLSRVAATRAEPAHAVPPPPTSRRRGVDATVWGQDRSQVRVAGPGPGV